MVADVKMYTQAWLRETPNLKGLSGAKFRTFVNETLIPKFIGHGDSPEAKASSMVKEMSEVWKCDMPVCEYTCARWLHLAGGVFCEKSKTYMCDKHEDN